MLMEVLPDRIGLFPQHLVLPDQSTIPLRNTPLPPQRYKAIGGMGGGGFVFEEMTAGKIGLAFPLMRVFVVKMRVAAGECFATEQFDR